MSSWLEGSPICLAGHSFHRRAAAETDFATYLDEVAQARMVVQGRSLDGRFGDETVDHSARSAKAVRVRAAQPAGPSAATTAMTSPASASRTYSHQE